MNFRVGQKVVCVKDSACPCCGDAPPLTKGRVYTVRHYYIWKSGKAGILVDEVAPGDHTGFSVKLFRPATDKQTDISIFEAMLNRAPERIDA